VDWNNDGKKDLLTGERGGVIYAFINQGTDQSPVFNISKPYTNAKLLVDGSVYNTSKNNSMIDVVDWDNDARKDLIVGFEEGYLYFLRNVGTDQSPSFSSASRIMDGNSPLYAYKAAPRVVDWDRDGKKDLIVGAEDGHVYFYRNMNTDAAPLFSGREMIKAGGETIDVGMHSRLCVTDWNNDNALDLVVGDANGYVHLFLAESPPAAAAAIWLQD
jgi:large repetitive protein